MTAPGNSADDGHPAMTFEAAALAHLRDFKRAAPEQKLQWLADMLEIVQERERAASTGACKSAPDGKPR